jgi:ubiquinone/menaquinone biosynthesis C-methylase UbiE
VEHADHVALIRAAVRAGEGSVWADLGSGRGAFTLALAELLGPGSTIHVVDRDRSAVDATVRAVSARFTGVVTIPHVADFSRPLALEAGSLDGLVMANALHFVRDKPPVLRALLPLLRPGGRFLLVEYDTDRGNTWVPWPVAYATWERLAAGVGLVETRKIGEVPSRFLGSIYAAVSRVGAAGSTTPARPGLATPRGR